MDSDRRTYRAILDQPLNWALLPEPITLLLVDSHQQVRHMLETQLNLEPDLLVVGAAGDGATALNLAQTLRPDVILMDIELPWMNGIWATRAICAITPSRVVILTPYENDYRRAEATAAGAAAFLVMGEADAVLLETIRQVARR